MVGDMDNTPNMYKMYVRAIPRARTALKRMLADLSGMDSRINQEVLVTATWLWLESMGAETAYEQLRPFIAEVDAACEGKVEAADSAGSVGQRIDVATGTPKKRRPKGRGAG
jgi:hypothetical protein